MAALTTLRTAVVTVCLLAAAPCLAQQSAFATRFDPAQRAEIVDILRQALKTDPSILRDAVVALQQDQQTKAAAAASGAIVANRQAIFDNPVDPVAGNPHGSVTLVEFYDVRCPYCRRMRPDLDALLAQDPDVRVVFKDLPVLGPASLLGAKALLAAQAQGGYMKLQPAMMANGATLDEPAVQRAALAAGLNWPAMQVAMNDRRMTARVDANHQMATLLGIEGTPAIVVGDQLVSGAMTLAELKAAVAKLRK